MKKSIAKNRFCLSRWIICKMKNCKCSSLGFYKVAEKGKMNRNPQLACFKLDGLSETNSNARKRKIYIHADSKVAAIPFDIPWALPLSHVSEGCFTTTFRAMRYIGKKKEEAKKPIVLYAFY